MKRFSDIRPVYFALGILFSIQIASSSCQPKDPGPSPLVDNRVFYAWDKFNMGVDLSYIESNKDNERDRVERFRFCKGSIYYFQKSRGQYR